MPIPKPDTVIISFPVCNWCALGGSRNIFKCRSCKKWTCNNCLVGFNTSDHCEHKKNEELVSEEWA